MAFDKQWINESADFSKYDKYYTSADTTGS